jgi:hypothetical protein
VPARQLSSRPWQLPPNWFCLFSGFAYLLFLCGFALAVLASPLFGFVSVFSQRKSSLVLGALVSQRIGILALHSFVAVVVVIVAVAVIAVTVVVVVVVGIVAVVVVAVFVVVAVVVGVVVAIFGVEPRCFLAQHIGLLVLHTFVVVVVVVFVVAAVTIAAVVGIVAVVVVVVFVVAVVVVGVVVVFVSFVVVVVLTFHLGGVASL